MQQRFGHRFASITHAGGHAFLAVECANALIQLSSLKGVEGGLRTPAAPMANLLDGFRADFATLLGLNYWPLPWHG
eukprot:11208048-Lingulodinium_polyedra.AAC.1